MSDSDFISTMNEENCDRNEEIGGVIQKVMEKLLDRVERERSLATGEYFIPFGFRCINEPTGELTYAADSSMNKSKQSSGSRKIRVRNRRHKWKPYHKLTGDERRRLDERNTRRAEAQHRQLMEVYGLTLAPFNTTQYLMEEHERDNMAIKSKEDYNSSEDLYSSPEDEVEFIQKQFSEIYDSYHESYINNMNKTELVRELMRLEDEIENLEQRLGIGIFDSGHVFDYSAEFKKIAVFQEEIKKLTIENDILEQKNLILRSQVLKLNSE